MSRSEFARKDFARQRFRRTEKFCSPAAFHGLITFCARVLRGSIRTAVLIPRLTPGTGFNSDVYDLARPTRRQNSGGGHFQHYNGTPRDSVARINTDGTLDTTFNPAVVNVAAVAVQPDGKILIAGDFDNVNGTSRTGFARLNADGSLDNSFNPVLGHRTWFFKFWFSRTEKS